MKIINDKSNWNEKAVVATIGFFDGVHRGHRFLLQEMKNLASESGISAAIITFPVHPRVALHSNYQPKLLNSFDEKLNLLSKTCIDYAIVLDFTPALASLSAFEFITTVLVPEWHVEKLLVGYDHHFGRQHAEGFEQFIINGKAHGIEVIKTSSYDCDNGMAISSSMIRRLIENGEVAVASRLLGYHYQLKGHVVNGRRLGHQLGFPTANISLTEPFKAIPQNGSYIVRITIGEKKYNGMLYVGSRPTIGADDISSIEAHIFDFSEEIYNELITVEFIDFIRAEMKFTSLEELSAQLEADKKKAMLNNL